MVVSFIWIEVVLCIVYLVKLSLHFISPLGLLDLYKTFGWIYFKRNKINRPKWKIKNLEYIFTRHCLTETIFTIYTVVEYSLAISIRSVTSRVWNSLFAKLRERFIYFFKVCKIYGLGFLIRHTNGKKWITHLIISKLNLIYTWNIYIDNVRRYAIIYHTKRGPKH